MSRFTFAALASLVLTSAAAAQEVPGRDLMEFPLGLVADAPALSTRMIAGLWNPAAASLRPGARGAIGFAGLNTPKAQGVALTQLGGEVRVRSDLTVSASFAQAAVKDIFRTEASPDIIDGDDIPYQTSVLSLGAALSRRSYSFGLAARRRTAQFDNERGTEWSLDGGIRADSVLGHPLRAGASTFLFSPWKSKSATYSAAADYPVYAPDSLLAIRGGYSITRNESRGYEDYFFSATTYRELDANAGLARIHAFGNTTNRLRVGIGLHHAGYNVAFGRENGVSDIGASYQVILTRTFR